MRLIKMLGLAAVAAIAAMAFIGASSAMAKFDTALCSEASPLLECPAAKLVKHVHFIAKDGKLLNPLANVLCAESLISAEVEPPWLGTAPKALGLIILPGGLTYTGCVVEATATKCEVTVLHLGLLDLLKTAANLGTLIDLPVPLGGGEAKYSEVKVVCGVVINCTYKGEGLTGHALGSNLPETAGKVTYTAAPVTKVGGITCPKEAFLDATYESLVDLWIRS